MLTHFINTQNANDWLARRILSQKAITWGADAIKKARVSHIVIDSETFHPPILLDTEPFRIDPPKDKEKITWSKCRTIGYGNVIVPTGVLLDLYTRKRTLVTFNGDVMIPTLFNAKRRPWMSLTPGEMLSMQPGIRKATKKVVVGGLGLGYLLEEICKKPSVKEVMVCEESQAVIDMVWTAIKDREHIRAKNVQIVHGDVYKVLENCPPSTRVILDIWPNFGDAANDAQLIPVYKKFRYTWAWGDVTW